MAATMAALGVQPERRRSGLLDGATPYYDLYETADGRHVSVGALEPQFYADLIERLGLTDRAPDRDDPAALPALRDLLTETFRQRTQAEWAEVFDATDACVAPVLPLSEAAAHPHLAARGTFVDVEGITQPAPAPRFSRTPGAVAMPPGGPGAHTRVALIAWGTPDVDALLESGAAVQA
jgi:alpha-methylacyl-CoA racemase